MISYLVELNKIRICINKTGECLMTVKEFVFNTL